jgi:hypothetical protein
VNIFFFSCECELLHGGKTISVYVAHTTPWGRYNFVAVFEAEGLFLSSEYQWLQRLQCSWFLQWRIWFSSSHKHFIAFISSSDCHKWDHTSRQQPTITLFVEFKEIVNSFWDSNTHFLLTNAPYVCVDSVPVWALMDAFFLRYPLPCFSSFVFLPLFLYLFLVFVFIYFAYLFLPFNYLFIF